MHMYICILFLGPHRRLAILYAMLPSLDKVFTYLLTYLLLLYAKLPSLNKVFT